MLENPDPALFEEWVPKLMTRLQTLPELVDVADDLEQHGQTVNLVIDRSAAARYGITPATIDNALYDSFGQRIVSTIFTQTNQYRVILEADPLLQHTVNDLASIYLPSASSSTGQVPLSAIVQVQEQNGPLQITHLGQFPATDHLVQRPPPAARSARR